MNWCQGIFAAQEVLDLSFSSFPTSLLYSFFSRTYYLFSQFRRQNQGPTTVSELTFWSRCPERWLFLPSSDSTSWGKGPYVTHLRLSAVTDGAGSLWTRGWGRRKAGISEFIKKQNQLYKYIIYKNQKAWTSTQSKSQFSNLSTSRPLYALQTWEQTTPNGANRTGEVWMRWIMPRSMSWVSYDCMVFTEFYHWEKLGRGISLDKFL